MSKHSKANDDLHTGKGGKQPPPSAVSAHRASLALTKGARSAPQKREAAWIDVASFVISFEHRAAVTGRSERRITAHKMQDGGITAEWTGLAQQPLAQWIADHVGDWGDEEPLQGLMASAETSACIDAKAIPCDTSALVVSVTKVEAHQAGGHRTADGARSVAETPGAVALQSSTAFELEAVVEISAPCGQEVSPHSASCTVQFFSRNTSTLESSRLGEVLANVRPGTRGAYAATLPRVKLPAGTYRVASVAILKGVPPKLAYAQGPMLEIA